MSNHRNSDSHIRSNLSNIHMEEATNSISSAYKIIHNRLTPVITLAKSFKYILNNVDDKTDAIQT